MDEGKSTRPQPPDAEGHGQEIDSWKAVKPYEYTPLPDSEPAKPGQDPPRAPELLWTRLVTIHPGEYDDDIAVNLSNVVLVDIAESQFDDKSVDDPWYWVSGAPHLEQYEALSYVWGSLENPSYVVVGEEERCIPITRNLDVAMRHLRYPDRPRVMWIDALCIDQTSPSDKNRQVEYMRYIYWSTSRVVVWLGPEADDSDHAMDLIECIGKKIRITWQTSEIRCVAEEDEEVWGVRRRLAELPLDERDWAALGSLIKRPWFERIWIRQEISWIGEEDAVYCGKSCIDLNLFRRGVYRVTRMKDSPEAKLASDVVSPDRITLETLRYRIRGAKCTDPRDYIYGTLGLLSESIVLALRPDYSKSLEEIFQDVVLRHIDTSGSLDILEACGDDAADYEHSFSPGDINLPSWVPDWTSGTFLPCSLGKDRRFVRISAKAEYNENGFLRVAGLSKGVIQDIIDLDAATQLGLRASLRAIVPENAANAEYPGGGSLWDAYRIALCGNRFKDPTASVLPVILLGEEESHTAFESIIRGTEPTQSPKKTPIWPDDSPEYRYYFGVRACWDHQEFFITEDGLVGWAPNHARQGDQIVIMLGSETPMVLRPVSLPETDQYEVIGPCYLQGFMFGEAFLGPLPEGVRPIANFDVGANEPQYFEFHNALSGDVSPQDPRSDAISDPDQSWAWRRGQTQRLVVEVEDLRSAGLDIQYFDLV